MFKTKEIQSCVIKTESGKDQRWVHVGDHVNYRDWDGNIHFRRVEKIFENYGGPVFEMTVFGKMFRIKGEDCWVA